MNTTKGDTTQGMKTLLETINESIAKGFIENFKITASGLSTLEGSTAYAPREVSISDFFRFEGYSDPNDNCILYLIETNDGRKGLLIDAYGVDAEANISDFLHEVRDIQKNNTN